MADNSVEIKIRGSIDPSLPNSVSQAAANIDRMTAASKGASGTFADMKGSLSTVTSGLAAFGIEVLAPVAAIAELTHKMEESVEAAEKFGLGNAKFAAMLGTSAETAAGLDAALKGVGASSDEYAMMLMHMEMRLRLNEKAFRDLGVATRDSRGALLDGQSLMQNAISTMEQYRAGTDQNTFALEVFGRGARDVYDIMRVTTTAQAQYLADMREFGVDVGPGAAQASAKLEEELARQKQRWTDIEIAVGQKLEPVVTEFLNWLNTSGTDALKGFEDVLLDVAKGAAIFGGAMRIGMDEAAVSVRESFDIMKGTATATWDILHGNLAGAQQDWSSAWGHMKSDAHNAAVDVDAAIKQIEDAIGGVQSKASSTPLYPSGNRRFHDPKDDGGQDEYTKQRAEQAKEAERDIVEANKEEAAATVQAAKDAYQAKVALLDQELAAHQITAGQKRDQTLAALQDEVTAEVKAQNDIINAWWSTVPQMQAAEDELSRIKTQSARARSEIEKQYTRDEQTEDERRFASYKTMVGETLSLEGQLVSDIFTKRQKLSTDLLQLGEKMAQEQAAALLKYGAEQAFASVGMMSQQKANDGAPLLVNAISLLTTAMGLNTAAQNTSVVPNTLQTTLNTTAVTANTTALSTSSATGGGGLISSVESMFSQAGGGLSSIFSFLADLIPFDEGTDYVPRTMPALVHQGEMIVPAGPAAAIRAGGVNMAAIRGGSTNIGGDTHYHVNLSHNSSYNGQSADIHRMMRNNPQETAAVFMDLLRQGHIRRSDLR